MSLTQDQVQRVAHLARIEINQEESLHMQEQLNGIFSLIEEMQSVNTQGIEPMAHAQDLEQRLRTDEVTEQDRRDEYQKVAPETESGLYLVPRVIE